MRWGCRNRDAYRSERDYWWPFHAWRPYRCEVCWGWFWLETGIRKLASLPYPIPDTWRYRHFMGACERAELGTLDDNLTAERRARTPEAP